MEEFATVCGVSRPTVSKFFNDPRSVRSSTRARIEAALARYDFRPNLYAMNQNRRQTKTVGVVVPYLVDPFFAEIARKAERACIAAGFRPLLLGSHGEAGIESENLELLRSLRPAGILLAPLVRDTDRALVEKCCGAVPTVLFDGQIEGVGEAFFGSDNRQSVDLLVEYLCRSGDPPCFFEMTSPPNPNADKRRAAYLAAMDKRGLEAHLVQVEGSGWDFEDIGYREGLRALDGARFATNTVLCSNDRLAIGFLAAAYERGIPVGRGGHDAIRVAGHDDHPFSRFTCPPLTTISQDYGAITQASVDALVNLIAAAAVAPAVTLFDGRLVMRESA